MIIVGAPRERRPDERRVAMVPELVTRLVKAGLQVHVEEGAGEAAGFVDSAYRDAGAQVVADVVADADILLKVQPPTQEEAGRVKAGAAVIGFLDPIANADVVKTLAARSATAFAMNLMPRITRAQPMDALSAMSTVAGYKAVLLAANRLPRFFPLLMTAAGTVQPARVFIIGAGVAGLASHRHRQTPRRCRRSLRHPAGRARTGRKPGRQVRRLGNPSRACRGGNRLCHGPDGGVLPTPARVDGRRVARADVVITTALVPGKRAPVLITEEMVRGMRPGSVIVDLAAEQGGNCDLTQAGQDVVKHGVVIIGPVNLPSTVAFHASQMYARTVINYLLHLFQGGALKLDLSDDLTRVPLVTHQGQILQGSEGTAFMSSGS